MDSSGADHMTPDQVASVTFETRLRGVDSKEVTAHLNRVADVVRSLLAENASLRTEADRLVGELAERNQRPVDDRDLDEDLLTERLGHEAGRVLSEARAAAADRIAEAEAEAVDIRAAAEELHADRSRAADLEAGRIRTEARELLEQSRADAEAEGDRIREQAELDATGLRDQIASEGQAAEADAARIIREAELTRRRILEDLARRRSSARRQIEQLRAGRERLLGSHEIVRRALDEINEELTISMSEARAAAETAGHSVSDTTIEELEAEIETARLTGLLDTGPVPVIESTPSSPISTSELASSSEDSDTSTEADEPTEVSPDVEETRPTEPEPGPEGVVDADQPAADAAVPDDQIEEADPSSDDEPVDNDELAEVLQLDRARGDVDTAKHPAAGREKAVRAGGTDAAATQVAAPADELENGVDDLFARMRTSREIEDAAKAAEAAKQTKSAKVTKPASEVSDPKSTNEPRGAASVDVADDGDFSETDDAVASVSDELARRLKRVLADEQSEVMSALRVAKKPPTTLELLGSIKDHRARYWVEVEPAALAAYRLRSGGKGKPGRPVRAESEEMVAEIRRRVEGCFADRGDDIDEIIDGLRSVYREIKTQRLSDHADSVCQMAADLGAERS